MGIRAVIFGAIGVVILLEGLSVYLTGKAYLAERDKTAKLEFSIEVNKLAQEYKEARQKAVNDVRAKYDLKISAMESGYKEKENGYVHEIMEANKKAAQKPIEFGDGLIRDLIRVDCLWSKGEAGASLQGRAACSGEATNADPASTGFSYTVFTPDFLKLWYEACDQWPGSPGAALTLKEWRAEYRNFDPAICGDTLVALPPDASKYISRFVSNGEAYTSQLINYTTELNEVIDKLTEQKDDQR